jgi:hypothetical protein
MCDHRSAEDTVALTSDVSIAINPLASGTGILWRLGLSGNASLLLPIATYKYLDSSLPFVLYPVTSTNTCIYPGTTPPSPSLYPFHTTLSQLSRKGLPRPVQDSRLNNTVFSSIIFLDCYSPFVYKVHKYSLLMHSKAHEISRLSYSPSSSGKMEWRSGWEGFKGRGKNQKTQRRGENQKTQREGERWWNLLPQIIGSNLESDLQSTSCRLSMHSCTISYERAPRKTRLFRA